MFVPVYVHVEVTVALMPSACQAEELVAVKSGGPVSMKITTPGADVVELAVAPLLAEAEGVRVPERMVFEAMDPVSEGKLNPEAAADAGGAVGEAVGEAWDAMDDTADGSMTGLTRQQELTCEENIVHPLVAHPKDLPLLHGSLALTTVLPKEQPPFLTLAALHYRGLVGREQRLKAQWLTPRYGHWRGNDWPGSVCIT